MSWIGWVAIAILGLNLVFFGTLWLLSLIEDKAFKRWKK